MTFSSTRIFRLAALAASAAFLITGASAQSVSWGSYGSLKYSVSTSSGHCGYRELGSYTYYDYSNFVYTGPDGTQYSMGEEGQGVKSPDYPQPGCPAPVNATFDYVDAVNGYEISFDEGSANLLLLGGLAPRFQLLSLLYAPPGHASYVDYSNTTTIGSSFSISSSFTSQSNVSLKFGIGVNESCGSGSNGGKQICGTGALSGTGGSSFTQEQDTSSTTTVSQEQGYDIRILGPQPNTCLGQTNTQMDDLGLDHDYDAFLVWLNPVIDLAGQPAGSGGALYWTGYSFDQLDTSKNIDYVALSPGELKDPNFPSDLQPGNCYSDPGLYTAL